MMMRRFRLSTGIYRDIHPAYPVLKEISLINRYLPFVVFLKRFCWSSIRLKILRVKLKVLKLKQVCGNSTSGPFLSFCYLSSSVYHHQNMIQKWRFGFFCVSPTGFLVRSPVYHGCITDTVFGPLTYAVSVIQLLIAVYQVHWH